MSAPREPRGGRALALAVIQRDREIDPNAALATLPDACRYLLRPPALSGDPHLPGVRVQHVAVTERGAAAALVRHDSRAEVVVVLMAGEEVSAELASALAALGEGTGTAVFAAARVHRFLGRNITDEPVAIAWRGEPGASVRPVLLAGRIVTMEPDITTAIAGLDAAATREARGRVRVGAADFLTRPAAALARRLWARRASGVPGAVLAVLETYGEVLTAAKVWEREERAADARVAPSRRPVPAGFVAIDTRSGFVVVREELRDPLLGSLLRASPEVVEGEPLNRGGRGATWAITLGTGNRAVLRWYRRGGLLRHLVRDRYFGWRARPMLELVLTNEARRRGIAVPEVLGARVDRLSAGVYRGAIVTREIAGAETLADAVRRDPEASERALIASEVARTVRRMHDRGLHHPDLNVGNILLSRREGALSVHVIDLDRARLCVAVPRWRRHRALRRLARSLAKLQPGTAPRTEDRDLFLRTYREGA